jgi:hypothetical protein
MIGGGGWKEGPVRSREPSLKYRRKKEEVAE